MKCKYKSDKGNCEAFATKHSEYCFIHDPSNKQRHLEAASKGGLVSRDLGNTILPPLALTQPLEVINLLQDTLNRVRIVKKDGSMDIRVANCIGYLAGQLLKAIEISDLASRLEIVERVILERKSIIKK